MRQPVMIATVPPAPPRPADAHKGTFGTVIVIGGSSTMIGAPAICAAAAFRAGAGLVQLACPADVLPFAIAVEPSATGIALGADVHENQQALHDADADGQAVLAVGPGLGRGDIASDLVHQVLRGRRTVVLDADGLNLLAATRKERPVGGPALVMTPHPGEFLRLAQPLGIREGVTDPATRPTAALRLAFAQGAVVVLKGAGTVVAHPDGRCYINRTGNPALATAGSGDVLTGLIAALIAQHLDPFDAAVSGVYLHGLAADLWAAQHGPSGLTARDLADLLPAAFQRHRQAR